MAQAKKKKRKPAPARAVTSRPAVTRSASPGPDTSATTPNVMPAPEVPPAFARRTEAAIPAGFARRPADDTALRVQAGRLAGPGPTTATGPSVVAEGDAKDEDVPQWATKVLEQLLTVTYWFDPGEQGDRFTATIRFAGQRTDVTGKPGPGDSFTREETYDGILPGSGPVAVTAEVRGINPGSWSVTAQPVARATARSARPGPVPRTVTAHRVPPPRRVVISAGPKTSLRTTMLLRSKVPGISRYAYAPLVALGVLTGLVIEALLLATARYAAFRPLMFSLAAVAAGVIGAKIWYGAVHRGKKWDGWCIQGFVAGAAAVVTAVAVAGAGLPAGAFLAAATPALLIGMGIGRHGCVWAGCCTGRPTASRWGIWSSDRRLGCRRMPAQLLEAWTALVIGAAALAAVLLVGLPRSGPVAVIGLAAYTLIRQRIFDLRDEPRQWRHGRVVAATVATLALIAGAALFAVA